MPSTIFEATISGVDSDIMGGTHVYYVAWEVTVQGVRVRNSIEGDSAQLLGVGTFQLGNDLTPLGLISGVGFQEPHWMNSEIGQWIPTPGQVGASFTSAIAQYIRWSISPGTEVHLYVFGDI